MKLEIELIPKTSFFQNVRSIVPERWDLIRRECYRKAAFRCEICAGRGEQWPVECHEVWEYNFKTHVQKLVRLIALCPSCHEVKHLGLAGINGRTAQAVRHFAKVNGLTPDQANAEVERAWKLWERKNTIQWKLDVSHLQEI